MSKRNNILFNKPDEPAFIKRLKAAAGYVEGPDINAKRASQSMEEREDRDDCDDEKPTVVVLNSGDLTAEEVDALSAADKAEEDDVPPDGKIFFKKPSKKSSADNPLLKTSTASPVAARESKKSSEKTLKDKPSRKDTKRQKALLSFNEEDEDS